MSADSRKLVNATFGKLVKKWQAEGVPRVGRVQKLRSVQASDRAVYTVLTLHNEIMNGGFHQYFWNQGMELAALTDEDLERINAPEFAAILRRAGELFAEEADIQLEARKRNTLEAFLAVAQVSALEDADDLFFDADERSPLIEQLAAYIRAHPPTT